MRTNGENDTEEVDDDENEDDDDNNDGDDDDVGDDDDDDDNGLEAGGRGSAPVNPLLLAQPPLHCYR